MAEWYYRPGSNTFMSLIGSKASLSMEILKVYNSTFWDWSGQISLFWEIHAAKATVERPVSLRRLYKSRRLRISVFGSA